MLVLLCSKQRQVQAVAVAGDENDDTVGSGFTEVRDWRRRADLDDSLPDPAIPGDAGSWAAARSSGRQRCPWPEREM